MLSVVVPIYNTDSHLLAMCVTSLINDINNIDYEILLINDGSDSFVKRALLPYLSNPRIRYLEYKNQGVSIARNKGIENSKGEWIMFVDPDDCVKLDFQNTHFNSNDILLFRYATILSPFQIDKTFQMSRLIEMEKLNQKNYLINSLLKISQDHSKTNGFYLGTPWGKIFKKDFLVANKIYFDPKLTKRQDALFCTEAYSKAKNIKILDSKRICYYYRIDNNNSITKKYNPNIKSVYLYLFKKMTAFSDGSKVFNSSLSLYAYDLSKELINLDFCNLSNKKKYTERKKDFMNFRNSKEIINFFEINYTKKIKFSKKILYMAVKKKLFFLINFIFLYRT